jgi:hypothetical protein
VNVILILLLVMVKAVWPVATSHTQSTFSKVFLDFGVLFIYTVQSVRISCHLLFYTNRSSNFYVHILYFVPIAFLVQSSIVQVLIVL